MAIKKVYIGGFGPFVYDDTHDINDPDGDFAGQTHDAIVTDGDQYTDGSVVGDQNVTGVYKVDGTQVVNGQQAAIADLSVTDPADTPATADELRDDLVANAIPDIETKVNAILAMLRTHGLIDT